MLYDGDLLEPWNNLPVGLVDFELDGSIRSINATVSRLLMPVVGVAGFENAYSLLEPLIPNLESMLRDDDAEKLAPQGALKVDLPDGSAWDLMAFVSKNAECFTAVIYEGTASESAK
ncbi:MAG: hypothetical protein AAF756_09385 [Pseudomonadota bacterium]